MEPQHILRFAAGAVELDPLLATSLLADTIEAEELDDDATVSWLDELAHAPELLADAPSLSLTLGLVAEDRFGTAPPLSLSRFAFSFFFLDEDVGLPKGCRDPDDDASNDEDEAPPCALQ